MKLAISLALALFCTACFDNTCCYGPPAIFDVYTYPGGQGTTFVEGAVEVIVNPDGFYVPGQFYDIRLVGFGTVPLPPGPNQRVLYRFLRPGTYRLICFVSCYDFYDPFCFSNRYEIIIDVFPDRTTRVDFRP